MSMVLSNKAAMFNDFDMNNYEVSDSLLPPTPLTEKEELELLIDMESNPDKYLYVDFLGSTYMVQVPEDSTDSPKLVLLEGAHFINLIPKRYWYFAEEYFWDKFQWAGNYER